MRTAVKILVFGLYKKGDPQGVWRAWEEEKFDSGNTSSRAETEQVGSVLKDDPRMNGFFASV